MAKYTRVRRLTGYGADGAVVVREDIRAGDPLAPVFETLVERIEAHPEVERVEETLHAEYPANAWV